jgi:DsbC/DsbD-like thiol-disulfide interchange protein
MFDAMARHPLSLASAVAVATAAVLLAVPAAAAISDWSSGAKAKMRLLAAGIGEDGRLSAAIEIALPKGWETYWRFPGDAGIAPTIDFSASRNLGAADVAYPLPQRVSAASVITNVYIDHVVLPVSAVVPDPKAAVDLAVSVDLGVCQTVCIPDHLEARLLVPSGKTDAVAAKGIADARAMVPGPAQPGVLAVDSVTRTGGTDKRPVFQVVITAPDAARATVFVETPSDWYPDAPKLVAAAGDSATYSLGADRLTAKTPLQDAPFRVTISAGGKAVEQTVPLH